jgi:SAM-dependent methyltransferase
MLDSVVCRFEHFTQPWYQQWAGAIGYYPSTSIPTYARKPWEYAAVLQTLHERGLLHAGARGLGFAVGTEPLPSYFAKLGVDVVATDLHDSRRTAKIWSRSKEHSASAEDLFRGDLVSREAFDAHVRFQYADMNAGLPFPERSFDFVWSCCAFEHLGGLAAGLRFVERSARLLKPGGVGVHTTEYNCSSNDRTVSRGPGVLYRRRDIEELDRRLRLAGRCLAKMDFWPGDHEYDRLYDTPPYAQSNERQHVKLLIDGYVCTSMLVTVVG